LGVKRHCTTAPFPTMAGYARAWAAMAVAATLLACVPWWSWHLATERAPMPRMRRAQVAQKCASAHQLRRKLRLHVNLEEHERICNGLRERWKEAKLDARAVEFTCTTFDMDETVSEDPQVAEYQVEQAWKKSGKDAEEPGTLDVFLMGKDAADSEGGNRVQAYLGARRRGWILLPWKGKQEADITTGMANVAAQQIFAVLQEIVNEFIPTESGKGDGAGDVEILRLDPSRVVSLSFVLSVADPSDGVYAWDFEGTREQFLDPIIRALAPLAEIGARGQRLQYAAPRLMQVMVQDGAHNAWSIREKDLSAFIDASLPSTGQARAAMHWIIYVPSPKNCPLHIATSGRDAGGEDAFLIPKWGGVIILNPQNCTDTSATRTIKVNARKIDRVDRVLGVEELHPSMGLVVAQMREMLGLTPLPKKSAGSWWSLEALPSPHTGFADWEIDTMAQELVRKDMLAALQSLQSLENLFDSIPNVVIKQNIPAQAEEALTLLEKAMDSVQQNHYWSAASAARKARGLSANAYFHPTILSLLYFPQEHKIAIYAPLFLPVFMVALTTVFRAFRHTSKKKKLGKAAVGHEKDE